MKILSILSTDKEVPFLIVVTRYYLGYKSKELNAIDEEDNNG
jgi:putative IMPACT (imprinted ancient) family translation regulator